MKIIESPTIALLGLIKIEPRRKNETVLYTEIHFFPLVLIHDRKYSGITHECNLNLFLPALNIEQRCRSPISVPVLSVFNLVVEG